MTTESTTSMQDEAHEIITGYTALRACCFRYARADNGANLGDYRWLRNAISEYDIHMDATPDGIKCSGSSWSSQTCGPEDFEFTVPYEEL